MSMVNSCESYLSADDDSIILCCNEHGSVRVFAQGWRLTISAEHVYAVWLKHLGEQ